MRLSAETVRRLWPRAPAELVDAVAAHSGEVFERFGLSNAKRVAHFMAQISHESGGGTITAEDLSYSSAARIAAVWPRRFTPASAAAYVHNPKKLADAVYNGRMGNRPGSDDGFDYRGRGLLQLTGRDSYRSIGALVGLPLENRPELAGAPNATLEIAAAEFQKLGCLPYCDADNVEAVTRRVNGGYTGLASRKAWLAKWKAALAEYAKTPAFDATETPLDATEGPDYAIPPPVEIPRGSDEVLPVGVDHPGKGMSEDRGSIAAVVGTGTAMAAMLGQAVDTLKPFLTDPHTLLAAAAIAGIAGAVILYENRARLRGDNV